jgi:hypothetical protein
MVSFLPFPTRHPIRSGQCSRFSFNTKRSHELALIKIGQYLRPDQGPDFQARIDVETISRYPSMVIFSDFTVTKIATTTDVRGRAGYTMLLNNCTLIWSSSLMKDVCLSTMMAEYYALPLYARVLHYAS